MTEAEWLACEDPEKMLEIVLSRASDRKIRYFGCACCRRVFPHMEHEGSQALTQLAEIYADGQIHADELETARRTHERLCHDPLPDWEYLNAADDAALMAAFPTASVLIGYVAKSTASAIVHAQARPSRIESHRRSMEAMDQLSYPFELGEFKECISTQESLRDQQNALESSFRAAEQKAQAILLRDIFGNPFRPFAFSPEWRTDTAVSLARQMYESREFGAMPILADALQDAGCNNDAMLNHCRDTSLTHVRGCWVVDLVLGKE